MQRGLSIALIIVSVMLIVTSLRLLTKDKSNKPENVEVVKTVTNCHDTLYIIEETKTEKRSKVTQDFKSEMVYEYQPPVLFKDGKTSDTILRFYLEFY